ncbi:MAG: YfhO family protein [Eubacteriaceae bacterium]|nr:YfhO family protein [Eubacteriaceae bacterium]
MSPVKIDEKKYLWHYCCFIAILAVIVLLLTHGGHQYGSILDWPAQHYEIPDYFRKLFYSTGDLFPDFDFNTGAGQNIYYISYYGLLSPVVLFSYLLPFISMKAYLTGAALAAVIVSTILMYRWLRRKYSMNIAFICALLFELASPITFHSHRHIMFILYLPFLILALEGVEKYIGEGRKLQFILCTFLTLMSNFFFAFSAVAAITVYGVFFKLHESVKFDLKDFLKTAAGFAGNIVISVMMSAVLLLPTLYILIYGRDATADVPGIKELFIPSFQNVSLLYGPVSMGLTAVFIISIVYGIISGKKHLQFLGIIFALFALFGAFTYALNGGMYIEGKILIPFIPVAIILIGRFLTATAEKEYDFRILLVAAVAVNILLLLTWQGDYRQYYIIDLCTTMILLAVCYYSCARQAVLYGLLAAACAACVCTNLYDTLMPVDHTLDSEVRSETRLVQYAQENDPDMWRTGSNIDKADNMNHVFNTDYLSTTIYSSLCNPEYKNYYLNGSGNEIRFRNSAMLYHSSNILFNLEMGEKYTLARVDDPPEGYALYKKDGNVGLYKNDDALPIGYVDPDGRQGHLRWRSMDISRIYDFGDGIKASAITSSMGARKYFLKVDSTKDGSLRSVPLKIGYSAKDRIIHLTVNVDNSNYKKAGSRDSLISNKKEDVRISVNDIDNKLSSPNWKYNNKNNSFSYVVFIPAGYSKLDIGFSPGKYTVSDFKADYTYYDSAASQKDNVYPLHIDPGETEGDDIYGRVDAKRSGDMMLSIPYDEGFIIKVDDNKVQYKKTSRGFITFPVKSGDHKIHITFEAPMKKAAMGISVAGILLMLLTASWRPVKERRQRI